MIFLSASIPSPDIHSPYFQTADLVAIRDAVRALARVVLPKCPLVFGGHPTVTPLLRYVMYKLPDAANRNILLYQSAFFQDGFLEDNQHFGNVVTVASNTNRKFSLLDMRERMIKSHSFAAGVFIGGMGGVEEEYTLFKTHHPNAGILPIASTGAAARRIFHGIGPKPDPKLQYDYIYQSMFKSVLSNYL